MDFEGLVKKITPRLKRITYKLNSRHTYFNNDDLYQEALIRLWQDYIIGKLSDKTESYILQGCFFHLKNYIRKASDKINALSLDCVYSFEDGSQVDADNDKNILLQDPKSSFDTIHADMLLEQIQNNGLTTREKEVFNLGLEGLATREIGRRLGISHVRVVKLWGKIREKCKAHMDE